MILVTKIFQFEACHHLPNYDGKCRNPHGHSYKLEVTVFGDMNKTEGDPKEGMLIDFGVLKTIVNEKVVDKYDHQDLNKFFKVPTAELMVESIAFDIIAALPLGVYLKSCKLWETTTSYAEWNCLDGGRRLEKDVL